MAKEVKKVAFLTAGGLAPCLSSSIGYLIDEYTKKAPNVEMIGYINGYMGLLKGESVPVTPEVRKNALILTKHGGSPLGNSRVKLTNVKDCVKRGLVKEGEDPLKVAADQLVKDGVDVLHTIGGDDTNTTAADLVLALREARKALFHDERGDAAVAHLRVGHGKHHEHVRDAPVGDKALRTVQHVVIAVEDRGRLLTGRVGTGVRLGKTERAELSAGAQVGQVFSL